MENLEAQTERTQAETEKIRGVDTEAARQGIDESKARVNEIVANAAKAGAETEVKKWEGTIKKLEAGILNGTLEDKMNEIKWTANKAKEDWKKTETEAYVAEKTKEDAIKITNQALLEAVARTALTWSNKTKSDVEAKMAVQQQLTEVRKLSLEWQKYGLEQFKTNFTQWLQRQQLTQKDYELIIKGVDAMIPF